MRRTLLMIFILCMSLIVTSCSKNVEVKLNVNGEEQIIEIKKGECLDSNYNPNIDGYRFDGWYLDQGYTTVFNITTQIKEELTLFAKLTKVFNVTINYEGSEKTLIVEEGVKIEDLEKIELAEKQFVGWYYDIEFKKFAAVKTVITEDITLYGKYIDKVYTLSFDTDGGYEMKDVKFGSGAIPEAPLLNPSKLGYEFTHWSLDKAGKEVYDFTSVIKEDFTLYANYVETDYAGLLDSIVPDVVDTDIFLPIGEDYLEYNWEISDTSLLSYQGVYNPDLTDKEISIQLTINVKGQEETLMFEKNVKIKKYELKKLVVGDVVAGYTSSWYYTGYSEEVLKTVDILNISFAYVKEDGTLNINDITDMLKETVGAGHKYGVRVCLSIQGYGEDTKNFSNCAADDTLRVKLAKSMVDAVVKYKLDGLDIDWEYPGSYSGRGLAEDRANYTLLIKEIRKQLDAINQDYLLTSAIPAGPWGHERFELDKLVNYFDFINMMSYDLNSSTFGTHHAALYPSTISSGTVSGCSVDETLTLWMNKGVPASKICLGIAFYGKDIKTRANSKNGLGASGVTGGKYQNSTYEKVCGTYFSKIGQTVNYNFDYSACAPYMYNTETRMFFTYDNELSIINKCEYAKEKGLGGVMIWEIGEDNTNTLITAVAQGMERLLEGKDIIVGGTNTFSVGDQIVIKAVKEVVDTALKDKLVYNIDNTQVATLDGNTLKLIKEGTVTITVINKETNDVYGTLVIHVK